MQDLLNRLKNYRANKLSKPVLDNTYIKDLKLDGVTNELPVNEKDNVYAKCRITRKEAVTGCIKTVKTKDKQIQVKIPKGIENGQQLILKGSGNKYSNLVIKVNIR